MDDRDFERLMEPLMEKIAEERIVPQNHKFSPDFEKKILQKAMQGGKKESVEELVHEKTASPEIQHKKRCARSKKTDSTVSKHYVFGGLAACILIAMTLGTMFHYSDEPELLQSTAVPIEVLESEHTASTMTTAETTACAEDRVTQTVTTVTAGATTLLTEQAQYETEPHHSDTVVSLLQTTDQMTAVPTTTTMVQKTIRLETTVTTQTTMTAPITQTYELGDVDMDGKITHVDAMLVWIDIQLAERGISAKSFLNDEQRVLGNVNGKDEGRYWDGVTYKSEWRSDLNDFGQQISYESYLLDEGDYHFIECMAILQSMKNETISFDEYNRICGYHNENLLLNDATITTPEIMKKYQSACAIMSKYNKISDFDCFKGENNSNSKRYSLDEFWADMEILRMISV